MIEREENGLPVGVNSDEVARYRESLRAMAPQTVWHTLHRATVISPEDVPAGFEWRIPIMRMHLVMLEYGGERFLEDPAIMGTTGDERERWWRHSARRFDPPTVRMHRGQASLDRSCPPPLQLRTPDEAMDALRERVGRTYYGDDEYERMREAGKLPGGLTPNLERSKSA